METGALSRVISEPGDPVGKTRARQKGKAGGRKERVAKGGWCAGCWGVKRSFLISNCRGREVEEGLGSAVVNCLGSV